MWPLVVCAAPKNCWCPWLDKCDSLSSEGGTSGDAPWKCGLWSQAGEGGEWGGVATNVQRSTGECLHVGVTAVIMLFTPHPTLAACGAGRQWASHRRSVNGQTEGPPWDVQTGQLCVGAALCPTAPGPCFIPSLQSNLRLAFLHFVFKMRQTPLFTFSDGAFTYFCNILSFDLLAAGFRDL